MSHVISTRKGVRWPPGSRLAILGLIVFGAIALHRFEILDSPPYTEQSVSHWGEADWLVENQFDYHRLRVETLHFEEGGPRVYWCSIFPTVMAVAMRADIAPREYIIAYRVLLVWLPAAILLVCVFELVRETSGKWIGVLVALSAYVTPIFSVQTEMLGMDIAMTTSAMFWWIAMHRRRFVLASLLAIVPFFLKPSAFVVPAAAVGYFGLSSLLGMLPSRGRFDGRMFLLAGANLLIFVGQIYLLVIGGNLNGRVMLFSGLGLWLRSSPDLLVLTVLAFVATGCSLVRQYRLIASSTPGREAIRDVFSENPLVLSGWFAVLLNLVAATVTYYESRHLLLVVPMVMVLLGRHLGELGRPRVCIAGLLGYIAFSVANAYGQLYPPLEPPVTRGWGVLERSLEYRADLASNIAASRVLDEQVRGEPLLAADQFLYFLKLPRLGYVQRPFGEKDYFYIARDADLLRILDDQPDSLVVTHVECQLGSWPFPAYVIDEPNDEDEILYNDHLNPPTIIYRRRFSSSSTKAQRVREYLDLLFSDAKHVDPAVRLAVIGSEQRALDYVAAQLGEDPQRIAVRRELIRRVKHYLDEIDAKTTEGHGDFLVWRLRDTISERLKKLTEGRPLQPLPWSRRTMFDTWPLRWQYFASAETWPQSTSLGASVTDGNSAARELP